ncbi:hypothetical protein ACQ4PT_058374 [Festuca glaucescens]
MASSGEVRESLQAVAQGLRWTYALLWKLCPDQCALVWAEGHYNGAIKTRKTVQPAIAQAPAPAEEADHHRSRQLRELFDSLAREAAAGGAGFRDVHGAGAHDAAARRPSAVLAPEDLTETEWFYLMCASYSFPPGVGLPGRAFSRGGHVWLSRANEVDSKVFSRAILAKALLFSYFPMNYWLVGENQAIVSPENAHYTETVLSILHSNTRRQAAEPNIRSYLAVSHQSSFSTWHPTILGRTVTERATPQRLLKSALLSAAYSSHCKPPIDPRCDNVGTAGPRREVDFSANHVLQERKRREKLNERFIILRSLVPFVTKMDKASILGDTIEYVKQLRKRIQELESSVGRQVHGDPPMIRPPATSTEKKSVRGRSDQRAAASSEKRKLAALEGSSSSSTDPVAIVQHSTDVQVSIIESDALLELRCPDRRGLLVRIMQALQEQLRLEVTAVQASSDDGVLLAELRAKVREVRGRSCISEVKRAIHLIISSG